MNFHNPFNSGNFTSIGGNHSKKTIKKHQRIPKPVILDVV